MELEKIREGVLSGKPLEEILKTFSWKEFEETVAEIFERNVFRVYKNFRFKTRRRYEIDLITVEESKILCVDCKEWSAGRHKKTSLKHAVEKQEKRTKEFKKFLKSNPIAKSKLKIKNQKFYPLIVTLLQEELIKENDTIIVPLWKLNSFLVEVEKYL